MRSRNPEVFPVAAGALVVSCQAQPASPLSGPAPMAMMARAAVAGGADGIRANGPDDVAAIRAVVDVPVIGIHKRGDRAGVYITPTVGAAAEVVRAGADVVAVDATERLRPDGTACAVHLAAIRRTLEVPVMADVDTLAAGLAARDAGAAAVATTLSGYVGDAPRPVEPDLALVEALASALDCPVVAEGRYATPDHVRQAFDAGAYAVVVGTAITNPVAITACFAAATPRRG